MQPTWFNVVECAKYLGVSKVTIYRLLDKKKIPAHRLGKLWKFNRIELDKWMLRKK